MIRHTSVCKVWASVLVILLKSSQCVDEWDGLHIWKYSSIININKCATQQVLSHASSREYDMRARIMMAASSDANKAIRKFCCGRSLYWGLRWAHALSLSPPESQFNYLHIRKYIYTFEHRMYWLNRHREQNGMFFTFGAGRHVTNLLTIKITYLK
jgi:hypothetical protein